MYIQRRAPEIHQGLKKMIPGVNIYDGLVTVSGEDSRPGASFCHALFTSK